MSGCTQAGFPRAASDHGPVVARVTHPSSGIGFDLCEPCLNEVFDLSDDRPELEPVAVAYRTEWLRVQMGAISAGVRTLVRRGTEPYGDLARRLLALEVA